MKCVKLSSAAVVTKASKCWLGKRASKEWPEQALQVIFILCFKLVCQIWTQDFNSWKYLTYICNISHIMINWLIIWLIYKSILVRSFSFYFLEIQPMPVISWQKKYLSIYKTWNVIFGLTVPPTKLQNTADISGWTYYLQLNIFL